MIERTFFEGSLVRARRACENLSSGRSSLPKRSQRFVPLALVASIQGPTAEPLTEWLGRL
jgi:hypothetical protein